MEKKILDVCCGSKMFWFDKRDDRVIFVDNRWANLVLTDNTKPKGSRRLEVCPDFIADFTKLPFLDNRFSMVVFDPPHLTHVGKNSWLGLKYGKLDGDWKKTISDGFKECFRVLKPDGILIFKWSEYDIPLKKILSLTEARPLFGHKVGKQHRTHWISFIK